MTRERELKSINLDPKARPFIEEWCKNNLDPDLDFSDNTYNSFSDSFRKQIIQEAKKYKIPHRENFIDLVIDTEHYKWLLNKANHLQIDIDTNEYDPIWLHQEIDEEECRRHQERYS